MDDHRDSSSTGGVPPSPGDAERAETDESDIPVSESGTLVSAPYRSSPLVAVIALLAGFGFGAYGLVRFVDEVRVSRNWERARGTVVEMLSRDAGYSKTTDEVYAPVVVFVDSTGREHQFTADYAHPPAARLGDDNVRVIYDPDYPSGARINTFFGRWAVPVFLIPIGGMLLLIGAGMFLAMATARRT